MDTNVSNSYFIKYDYQNIFTNKSSLKFFYANVRSIRSAGKFDELKCILKTVGATVHFLVLTETWFKTKFEANVFHIPNYAHAYNIRTDKNGGGVSIYIHNSLKFEITEEIYDRGIHYLWIYVHNFALHVGAIYKPDKKNTGLFLDTFSEQLEKRNRGIVLGDFNIDLLSDDSDKSKYLDVLQESGYNVMNKIHIDYCTRETATKKSILDHACSTLNENPFNFTIIDTPMADHKQIFLELLKQNHTPKTREKYTAIDYNQLYKNVSKANFENKDYIYEDLEKFIKIHIDGSRVTKEKILNLPKEDWINKEIITEIHKRNVLWKQQKTDQTKRERFVAERNRVRVLIKNTKEKYYYNKFKQYEKNMEFYKHPSY